MKAETTTTCFADSGQSDPSCELFVQGFEGADACSAIAAQISDPPQRDLFEPEGYVGLPVSWSDAFFGFEYPNSWGAHYPVGSWTIGDSPMLATYLTIPFVAESVSRHKLEWIPAVAIAQLGWYPPRPATGVLVTISTCPGDFRTSSDYAGPDNDPTLRAACRKFGDTGAIYFGQYDNLATCPVVAGQTYYLNIVFADPRDNVLDPTESTCDPKHPYYLPGVCDAEFYLRY